MKLFHLSYFILSLNFAPLLVPHYLTWVTVWQSWSLQIENCKNVSIECQIHWHLFYKSSISKICHRNPVYLWYIVKKVVTEDWFVVYMYSSKELCISAAKGLAAIIIFHAHFLILLQDTDNLFLLARQCNTT